MAFEHGVHRIRQLVQTLSGFGADGDHRHKGQVAGVHPASQVGLIDQSDGVLLIQTQIDDVLVLLGQRLGAVADEQHQVGILHSLFGAPDPQGLHRVGGVPDPGGVDEPQAGGPQHHSFLHRVPGGARDLRDDAAFKSCQSVQQAGFAHVGPAHDGGGHPLPQDTALTVGFQKTIQRFGVAAQIAAVVVQAEILDILIGIVQHRVEMAAKVHQVVVNGGQLFLQDPAYLSRSIGGGVGGVRFDQIDDGLRLGQVQLAVEKGPLGEFSPFGGFRPGQIQRLQPGGQYRGGAVTVKFHGILAGVAVGSPGDHGHALVDDPALLVMQSAQHQLPVRNVRQLFLTV